MFFSGILLLFSMIQWMLHFDHWFLLVDNLISVPFLLCSLKHFTSIIHQFSYFLVYPPRHLFILYMLLEYFFTKINLYFTYYFITYFLWLIISTFPWQYILILYHTQFYKQISSKNPPNDLYIWFVLRQFIPDAYFIQCSCFSCFHINKLFLMTFVDMT